MGSVAEAIAAARRSPASVARRPGDLPALPPVFGDRSGPDQHGPSAQRGRESRRARYDAHVVERGSHPLIEALGLVAPGMPLREGLDRILQADRGALVVVGDDPGVLSICTGGFLLDAEFSPQRLSELAKMDGAIILAADASRIARANVHLVPRASIPTSETGTRHRTAERVARSLDVPVITVSVDVDDRRLPQRQQADPATHRPCRRPSRAGALDAAAIQGTL